MKKTKAEMAEITAEKIGRLVANAIGPKKAMLWLSTPNPLLDDMAPNEMILQGRHKQLLKFCESAIKENQC